MLVLSRRPNEDIVIDERIHIRILGIEGGRVRVAIDAPREVSVVRRELLERSELAPANAGHASPEQPAMASVSQ